MPCFSRITFRLNKSVRIMRCFRSFEVISFIVFRNFLYFSQSRGSFDAIAFLLASLRSRMPFLNSELIQGAFFVLARLVRSGAWMLTISKNFVFQSAHKTFGASEPLHVQSCRATSLRKLSRFNIRIFEISVRMVQCPFEGKAGDNFL